MKIAWFGHVTGARGNGIAKYSREMIESLVTRGINIIFFYHASRERRLIQPNVQSVRIGSFGIENLAVISSARAPTIIKNVLQREQPNVAHVSLSFSQLDFSLAEICHTSDLPLVATVHFPYGPPGSFWSSATRLVHRIYASVLQKYDTIIVLAESQRAILVDYGVPPEQIQVIANGIDIDKYTPGTSDIKHQLGAQLLVTYVGRIDREKNVETLIQAYQSLNLPNDHKLLIVGRGTDLTRLQRRVNHDERIIFRGHISEEVELIRILRATDIFVLPSAVEGLSIAMLEAMACGTAVVATDVGADGEALRGAGIVIDLNGLDAQLPLALRTLIDYPEFRKQLGQAARTRAVEQYSLQGNLDKLIALYHELHERPHSLYRI